MNKVLRAIVWQENPMMLTLEIKNTLKQNRMQNNTTEDFGKTGDRGLLFFKIFRGNALTVMIGPKF